MRSVCRRIGQTLSVRLSGEIDQHTADELRARLDRLLDDESVTRIEFDMSGVSLMDSAGIGVLLGRYRRLVQRGGGMDVLGAGSCVERVLRMSGVYKLCTKGAGREKRGSLSSADPTLPREEGGFAGKSRQISRERTPLNSKGRGSKHEE